MNQRETIALFEQCEAARRSALERGDDEDKAHEAAKAVWNAWAEKLLAERGAEKARQLGNWLTPLRRSYRTPEQRNTCVD